MKSYIDFRFCESELYSYLILTPLKVVFWSSFASNDLSWYAIMYKNNFYMLLKELYTQENLDILLDVTYKWHFKF